MRRSIQRPRRRGLSTVQTVAGIVVLAGALGGGYWAWDAVNEGDGAQAQRAATADIAVATTMDFDIVTLATGELAAKNQVEVRSELDTMSTVVEIVAEGTRVKKGDQLVKLNGDQLQQQIDTQKPMVTSAESDALTAENEVKSQEVENESSIRKAQLKVELAELALRQWEEGEREKTLTQNAQAVNRAVRDLERLRTKAKTSVDLFEQGFLSSDEKELDLIALDEAETKLVTATLDEKTYIDFQEPRDRKQKDSDVTEAKAELDKTILSNEIVLISKKAQRDAKQENLRQLKERVAKLESQLSKCVVNAPTDGLVVYGSSLNGDFMWDSRGAMRIGREVAPNDLMIVLPDTSEMVSTVRVHESLAGRIRPGLPATMKIEAVGNAVFTGKVESIGVLAETSGWRDPNRREYSVKLVMDAGQDGEKLKPSMRCEATIQLGKVEQALAVPLQAIFNDGPVRFVYVPKGGKFVKLPVSIGQRSDAYAEITAGAESGQRVLVRQPAAAEVLDAPWDEAQLKVCGLKLNASGEPVPINGGGERGRPGGNRGGGREVADAPKPPVGEGAAPTATPDTGVAEGGDSAGDSSDAGASGEVDGATTADASGTPGEGTAAPAETGS